jgi:hypothetical protein
MISSEMIRVHPGPSLIPLPESLPLPLPKVEQAPATVKERPIEIKFLPDTKYPPVKPKRGR